MGTLGTSTLDLTADASKLDKGLNEGKKKVEGSLGGIKTQLSTFGVAVGNMVGNLAANAVTSITGSIMSSLKNSFQGYMEYADQVRDTSRSLGVSAEEASRLIQVADDVTISYDTLATSMRLAQKNGIDPSIEGLANLADQYLQLAPGVERTQFLLDTFGRSGAEMGKLLEQGGAGVRSLNEAIDENMVLTQDALEAQREYEIAVDDLSDAWTGLTYKVMPPLIRGMDDVLNRMRDEVAATKLAKEDGKTLFWLMGEEYEGYVKKASAIREASDAALKMADANKEATGTYDASAEGMSKETDAAKELEEQLKATSQANQQALNFTLSYADFMDSYADNHKKALDKVTKAQEALNKAIKEDKNSEQVDKLRDGLSEAQTALSELEASWHEKTQRMIYDMILTKLSVDGLTDAEYKAALSVGVTMGVFTEEEAKQAQAMMDVANATLAGIAAQEALKNKVISTTSAYMAQARAAQTAAGRAAEAQIRSQSGRSSGVVPDRDSGGKGKAGQPYLIGKGAQPELFIPEVDGMFVPNYNGSLSSMQGGGGGGNSIRTNHTSVTINNPVAEPASRSVDKTLKKLSSLGVLR